MTSRNFAFWKFLSHTFSVKKSDQAIHSTSDHQLSSHFHVSYNEWKVTNISCQVSTSPHSKHTSKLHPLKLRICPPLLPVHSIILKQKHKQEQEQNPVTLYSLWWFSPLLSFFLMQKESCLLTKNYAMEALNAAGLTPISVLCEKRTEPRKFLCIPSISPLKFSSSASVSTASSPSIHDSVSKSFHGSLVILSSVLSTGLAKALTYEEALQQSVGIPASAFDANEVLDNVINYATENPAVVAGGALVLAVPLILSQVFKKPKAWGVESAKKAYAVLGDDANAQLLDIRAPAELRKVGTPDVRGFKKKPVSIAYKSEDKPGFLKRLSLKFKEPENTTLFILDKYNGNSELVAELVTVNGFKAAYAIKDGAEGPKGWMNSSLPWIPPSKALSFDLSSLTDAFSVGDGSDALPLTLGIAVAAGLGAVAFSEIETILEVLGSAAIIQFASKKLLFAEDRKKTLKQVDEFLNTKIAPQELADEIKQIGKALLPSTATTKALPSAAAENTIQKAEAAAEPTAEINAVKAESVSGFSRPLSPYASYPDLKPPTSPTPSQP